MASPIQKRMGAEVSVDVTPGQRVAEKQTQVTSEMFFKVFGQSTVESWELSWDFLQNTDLPFDHPRKRSVIKFLETQMKRFVGERSDEFILLLGKLSDIKGQMDVVHETRLEQIAVNYFQKKFAGASINCLQKNDGVQLGIKIQVCFGNSKLTFYVKTHSEGRLAPDSFSRQQVSSSAKVLKPEELLIYEFLSRSGFGAQCHFFHRSPEDVYIATLDASFVGKQQGRFTTLNSCEGETLEQLTGGLSRFKREETAQMEAIITSTPAAQVFAENMVLTDIMSRLFRITDLSDNPDNYGFTFGVHDFPVIRIIDFRLRDEKDFQVDEGHFRGFLEGNGEFKYSLTLTRNPFALYILNRRAQELRLATGKRVMERVYQQRAHLDEAFLALTDYLQDDKFASKRDDLVGALKQYYAAVSHNFDLFNRLFSR